MLKMNDFRFVFKYSIYPMNHPFMTFFRII